MKKVVAVCLATIGLTVSLAHANLTVNGDFNDPSSIAAPTGGDVVVWRWVGQPPEQHERTT